MSFLLHDHPPSPFAQAAANALGTMALVANAAHSGAIRRAYRDHRLEWMFKSDGIDIVRPGLADDNIRFSPEFN